MGIFKYMIMRVIYYFLICCGLLCTPFNSFAQSGLIPSNLVVYEHFTNASCFPCAAYNPNFNTLMLANSVDAIAIRHHVWWPGFDPMYNFNPLDPSRLVNYYGVTGVPSIRLGNSFTSHPNTINQSIINAHILNLPNSWTYNVGTQSNNGILNVFGSVFSSSSPPNNDNVLRIYLVEDSVIYSTPPGNNGEVFFPNVLRKILPDSNGIFCGNGLTSTNFNFSFSLPANINFSKLSLVFFVQSISTRFSYKGARIKLINSVIQNAITIQNILNTGSCLNDTSSVTISHPTLNGVANASLRMTYNPDSLTYVGFNSLNPAFYGMTISGGNGVITMDWNSSSNQTIAAGNMVNLRFRVNGNSNITWDTLIIPSEFYDSAYNLVPQTFSSGSINHRTTRLVWNRNICQGQSFTLGNQTYTTSGTYQGRTIGTGGACDTLITLNLNVIPRQTNPSVTVCSNQPYSFNGLQLNTSGVYLDTLVNILGCDSIVQLNLTVNPAYNQNLTMTICAGGSLQFGNQNLTVAGNYTNTFVSSRSCDSLVNLSLTVSNSTTIVSSNGQNGFCPNGSVRIGLANSQPNATYTWRKDGAIIPNATSDTLSVNQTGNYQLAVQVSPTCIIQSNTLTIGILNCNRISGDLRYDNNNQTPLAGIPVHLKTLLGNIVASDTTDSSGYYDMAGYANGNYLLDASVNYIWGGVNSTDALQVTRYFTSLVSLSPLRIKVGDVNGSGITNSGDALLINRRITGLITSFSVGNFVSNLPSVNALGNPLVANLRALSTGDVNGTYNPQPTAPTLVLDTVIGGFGSGTATVRFTSSGSGVFERGICWGTSPNPTVLGNKMVVGSGGYGFTQVFSGSMVGNQLHYARAYARTSSGIFYSNEKTFTSLGIRSNYAGGIVFYLDSTGQHGLVCAPSDQGLYGWGCYGTNIGGTFTAVGTGQANTNLILSGCSARPIAASVCDDLVLNGYSDWYLPSLDELQLMYSHLHVQGIGGFINNGWYNSSSQLNRFYGWTMNFGNGNVGSNELSSNYVRAVRAF